MNLRTLITLKKTSIYRNQTIEENLLNYLIIVIYSVSIGVTVTILGVLFAKAVFPLINQSGETAATLLFCVLIAGCADMVVRMIFQRPSFSFAGILQFPQSSIAVRNYWIYSQILNMWNFSLILFFSPILLHHAFYESELWLSLFFLCFLFCMQNFNTQINNKIYSLRFFYRWFWCGIVIACAGLLFLVGNMTSWLCPYSVLITIFLGIVFVCLGWCLMKSNYEYYRYASTSGSHINPLLRLEFSWKGSVRSYMLLFAKMVMRSPLLRRQVLLGLLLSLMYSYLYRNMLIRDGGTGFVLNIGWVSILYLFPIILQIQFLFSSEGSFFDKLIILPSFRKILIARYIIFILFSTLPVLIFAAINYTKIDFFPYLAIYMYALGPLLLSFFGCILFVSSKVDLLNGDRRIWHTSSHIQSFYCIIVYMFWIMIACILSLFSGVHIYKVIFVIGIVSMMFAPHVLDLWYRLFMRQRHIKLEKFRINTL